MNTILCLFPPASWRAGLPAGATEFLHGFYYRAPHRSQVSGRQVYGNYLINPGEFTWIGQRKDNSNDLFLLHQGTIKGLGKVQFHDYFKMHNLFDLPNIQVFKIQIELFKKRLVDAGPEGRQVKDIDYVLVFGELFASIVYGHLTLEKQRVE